MVRNLAKLMVAAMAGPALGVSVLTSGCAASVQAQSVDVASPQVLRGEWRDPARSRNVPYKIYLPAGVAPAPVVIFSHGLGGSREAATFLMEYLARNGIVAVAIQHPGSDSSILENGAARGRPDELIDPRSAVARFGDVRFVIDQLENVNRQGPLSGRLDLEHLGMSGHSYGALTTLVAVGQQNRGGRTNFADPRIDAAIVYSPNAPRNQDPEEALGGIRTPILHFTGTEDRSRLDLEETPAGRQIPFRTITGADQYLIVFDGGDHMIFSGRVQASGRLTPAQEAQTQTILDESLVFWRAYLMGDHQAMAALCSLPSRVQSIGTGEVRASRC
jgi:predicted dienelactone hydrolase